ncbi:FAD-dependent oxidoreductase [soil metagenome]
MAARIPLYDVIIIGGSFAGLSCAMTLGRSLRRVLIINEEKPRNRRVDKAHNFLLEDGREPFDILNSALKQVRKYKTIKYIKDIAVSAKQTGSLQKIFTVKTKKGLSFSSDRLMIASGVRDITRNIKGFGECWGRTIVHCPYCHGYEIKNKKIGLLCEPEEILDLTPLLLNLTDKITIFTNGRKLSLKQKMILNNYNVRLSESKISEIVHKKRIIKSIKLDDGTEIEIESLFTHLHVEQCSSIPGKLGVKKNEKNIIITDENGRTNVDKVYAAGDCTNHVHQISTSIAGGSVTAMCINREMVDVEFSFRSVKSKKNNSK